MQGLAGDLSTHFAVLAVRIQTGPAHSFIQGQGPKGALVSHLSPGTVFGYINTPGSLSNIK